MSGAMELSRFKSNKLLTGRERGAPSHSLASTLQVCALQERRFRDRLSLWKPEVSVERTCPGETASRELTRHGFGAARGQSVVLFELSD